MDTRFDACVRGGGIVGMCLALALSRQGLRVALQDASAPQAAPRADDVRAYALNAASQRLLVELRVWDALPAGSATPVHDMRVMGDARAATLNFSAWTQCVRELACIVDAAALEAALADALRFAPHVTRLAAGDAPEAALLAIAEGRDSTAREALGIEFERHDYGQRAIAARLVASEPHRGRALQWFRAPDVLALLPFDRPEPERSYALVWSLPSARAAELMAFADADFERVLNEATRHAAGTLALGSSRAAWPLAFARAERSSGAGHVLLGDAAHLVHPLAGQGLNLGLGDVIALARVIAEREPWRGLGDPRLLRRYERERAAPTLAMGRLTDGLWQLFASPAPVARELRNRGLTLVNHLSPLKRWLTARALDS
jgi:2-polyprenyl-6-methoxyphenol hydroxylase-like FAD-dependent oxidoreductase